MAVTSFGEFARNLRLERRQNLKVMAENLEVSSAFLSAVENGKKKVPKSWCDKICVSYGLNNLKKKELEKIVAESKAKVVLNLENATPQGKEFARLAARSFEKMDEDTLKRIEKLLSRGKKEK